jgi:hypothetical protein
MRQQGSPSTAPQRAQPFRKLFEHIASITPILEMGEDEKEEDLVQAANVQRQVDFIADNFSLDEEDWEQFLTGLQDADFC